MANMKIWKYELWKYEIWKHEIWKYENMNVRDLSTIDGKVAGAVEDDEEVGEGSTNCHLSTPDVDSWKKKLFSIF